MISANNIRTTGNAATVDWSGWQSGEGGVYPVVGVVVFDNCNNNTLHSNSIITTYNQIGGVYDTILGVQIKKGSSNNQLLNNTITTKGHAYAYGVEIVGELEAWSKNNALSGNIINTISDSNYANAVKGSANTANTYTTKNNISATAPTFAYPVYLENFTGKTLKNVVVTGNNVYGKAYVVYDFELWKVSGSTISNNNIVGVGKYVMGVATYESGHNTITYNYITTYGDDSAAMIPNVDAITAVNAAFKFQTDSNDNFVAFNWVKSSGTYAINAIGSAANTFLKKFLSSNKGNKLGDAAIFSDLINFILNNLGLSSTNSTTTNSTNPNNSTVPTNSTNPTNSTGS